MKTFGEKLKEIRDNKKVSQLEIAEQLGLHRSNYSKIENNHQKMTHEQLARFCEYMDVSADYLLGINVKDKVVYTTNDQREMNLMIKELMNKVNKK